MPVNGAADMSGTVKLVQRIGISLGKRPLKGSLFCQSKDSRQITRVLFVGL